MFSRTSHRRRPRCSRYAAHTKHGKAERYQRYGLVRIRALAQSASGQPEVSSPGAPRTPPHVPNLCFPERNEAPVKTLWVKRQPRPQDTITQSHSAHPWCSRQARSALRSGKHRWSAQRSWWTYAGTEGSGEASGPEMSICTPKTKPLRRLHGHRHLQRAEHKESAPRSQDFSVAFRPSTRTVTVIEDCSREAVERGREHLGYHSR